MEVTYNFKARRIERALFRKMKKIGYFHTVTGKVNRIINYSKTHLSFVTDQSSTDLKISRKKLKEAMAFSFFKKTIIRKDLERFSNHSSALLGILFKVFEDICKVQRTSNGLLRLTIKGVRFFFSGLTRSPQDMKLVKQAGGKYVLLSYAHIREDKNQRWLKYLKENKLYCLIDSGSWTIYNRNQKRKLSQQLSIFNEDISIEEYSSFINQYKDQEQILGFFNLDVIGDPVNTKKNYYELKNKTQENIIPVWQFDGRYNDLNEYVNDSPMLIGLGGMVPQLRTGKKNEIRNILNYIFQTYPDINFHSLSLGNELLHEFSFYSTDSTTWLNAKKTIQKIYLYRPWRKSGLKRWIQLKS